MTDISMALSRGFVLDRFTVDDVILVGASAITYRVTDTLTGSPFILCEHVPGGRVTRRADGSLSAQDEQAANELSISVARFLADGARAATFNHPGIARISRWFKANGSAYLVMPWVAGKSLAAILRDGPAPGAQELMAIALAVMDALDYLHGQGIIHREIGPEFIHVPEAGGAILLGCGAAAAHSDETPMASSGCSGEAYAAIE